MPGVPSVQGLYLVNLAAAGGGVKPALIDTRVSQFSITDDGTNKSILREALRGLVPQPILDRRDKIAFATPERGWLKQLGHWVTPILAGNAAQAIPALRGEAVLSEWEAVRAGRRPFGWHIWRWLNLIRWTEQTGACFS